MKSSLYIHIPFCKSKCEYCDFFSIPIGHDVIPNEYIYALCNEIKYRASEFGFNGWNTIYIGGGTPSILSENQIFYIAECIFEYNRDISEFTIELNPDDITKELLLFLRKTGITRISVGIQALNEDVLCYVKRRSSLLSVKNALKLINENWKGNLSVDVISGLPKQSESSFLEGVKELVCCNPDHISMYSLTIEENTPLESKIANKQIIYDFDLADEMWIEGRDFLERNGYKQYEISNFYNEKKGNQCVHNLVYWKLHDYVGVGSGATGSIYGNNSIRYTNTKNIKKYIDFWSIKSISKELIPQDIEFIDKKTERFEFFMMGLRTLEGVCLDEYRTRFGEDIPLKIKNVILEWEKRNMLYKYISNNKEFFTLGKEGILFLNKFLEEIIS